MAVRIINEAYELHDTLNPNLFDLETLSCIVLYTGANLTVQQSGYSKIVEIAL